MAERTYLLRKYDDVAPTHIMREMYLPAGEIWQTHGWLLVPPELANELGTPDSEVTIGPMQFPAWRMAGEMPAAS